jgi:hypothetical protein
LAARQQAPYNIEARVLGAVCTASVDFQSEAVASASGHWPPHHSDPSYRPGLVFHSYRKHMANGRLMVSVVLPDKVLSILEEHRDDTQFH